MEALDRTDPVSVGGYRLLARLGSGGMGRVYLGVAPDGHRVAVKVIREDFESPEALARFRREAATVGTVRGPFTAMPVASGLDETPYWLATEYVPGPTIAEAVRRSGPLPPETCLRLFAALARALRDVHGQGVQHRDLKPQNIILSADGPRLIDFGIAKGEDQTAITRTGAAPGTPGYLAPEVITQQSMSPAADIFALAGVMAFAATGRAPFGGGDPHAVLYRTVHGEIDVEGVDPRLAELIRWCAAKAPTDRPTPSQLLERCGPQEEPDIDPGYRALVVAHTEACAAADEVARPSSLSPKAIAAHVAPAAVAAAVAPAAPAVPSLSADAEAIDRTRALPPDAVPTDWSARAAAPGATDVLDAAETVRADAGLDAVSDDAGLDQPDGPDRPDRLIHAAPTTTTKGTRWGRRLVIGTAVAVPALVAAQLLFDALPIGASGLQQLKHPLVLQQVATIEQAPCKPNAMPDIDGSCYTFDSNSSRPLVLRQVADITVEQDSSLGWFVQLKLTPGDAAGLAEITDQAAKVHEGSPGRQVAIRLDREKRVLSAPHVEEKITGGRFQIVGSFTQKDAQRLARELTDGS